MNEAFFINGPIQHIAQDRHFQVYYVGGEILLLPFCDENMDEHWMDFIQVGIQNKCDSEINSSVLLTH